MNLKEENTGNEAWGIISEIKEISEPFLNLFPETWEKAESETKEKPKVKWFIHQSQNFPIKQKLPYSKTEGN